MKHENPNGENMAENQNKYDLDERTFHFTLGVRKYLGNIDLKSTQWTDVNQLLHSSGYIAATTKEPEIIERLRTLHKECDELTRYSPSFTATHKNRKRNNSCFRFI